MRAIKYFLLLLLIVISQTIVLPRIPWLLIRPDLFLLSAVYFALVRPRQPAVYWAAGAGLTQDLLSTGPYIHTIVLTVLAAAVSTVKDLVQVTE